MDTVVLAGRTVNRLGISLSGLKVTGMWGEPAGREQSIRAIRRAVELGAGVLEIPVPFGPAADLLREAHVADRVFIAARLTGPTSLDVLWRRLGRTPDLVLADGEWLAGIEWWPVPLGVIVGGDGREPGLAAVRGPYPAPDGLIEWCETNRIPYMAGETSVLEAGRCTVGVPTVRSVSEVERLFAERFPTPPAGGPG